jgi:xeroderma pigmentosum group C-complementing protein
MPPFLPRKHLRSSSPEAGPSSSSGKGTKKAKSKATPPRKPTLFDDLDAGLRTNRTAGRGEAILEKIQAAEEIEDSSLSSLSEDEFEDVPNAKQEKADDISEDEDEDMEFEDVQTYSMPGPSANIPTGDLELTLTKDERISLTNPYGNKKGPSKIERGIRVSTHQVHVQMLMWHNAIRNSWLCDKELQQILVKQLPANAEKEIERWRRDSGLQIQENDTPKSKGKGKGKDTKGKKVDVRSQRDWGEPAERLENGQVNLSHGDPLFKLLRYLVKYWKQRFRITAPGLRKCGYMSLERLDQEMKSFNKDEHDPERHGERIRDIKEFRKCAELLEGSRDVSAQLFTALLRGLGVEARMVASLQPVGFGWNKNEDAGEKKEKKIKDAAQDDEDSSEEDDESSNEATPAPKPAKNGKGKRAVKPKQPAKSAKNLGRRVSNGSGLKDAPINLSESEDAAVESDVGGDESIVDVTPAPVRRLPSKPYDKDLLFPIYWTEVLSPVTNTFTAVDPIVLNVIATNDDLLQKFETRGGKADKAKQVTAYIVGHSPDGTAKDVTIRYLKNHMLPGRTKGNRIPVEKVPVYNYRGKIKHYENMDWFKTVMSGYVRGTQKCPRTEIDDHEEATDLKAVQPKKKEVKEGEETLQSYKTSPEFVLERHLKREEAILPTAKHVKMFTVKSKGGESTEEKVFRRKDVVACKSIETWHKEGRAPLPDEEPRKRVPYRAATTNRKRELAEAEHATGEKMLQGLYSRDQTDWIIPPPIENGIIPKNNYGNMDVYVPSMVPVGAVHIPRRGTMKICKRLGIDYAEAVTGFEFGARMAIPIVTGVVVAEENYEMVIEEWEKDEAERIRKEDEKTRKTAIGMWRKFLMGLRIVERVREEYGDELDGEADVLNPWTNKKGKGVDRDAEMQNRAMEKRDEDMAGGFFPEGHDEEEPNDHHYAAGFFPVAIEDDDDQGGGFMIEDDEPMKVTNGHASPTAQAINSSSKLAEIQDSDDDDEETEGAEPEPEPEAPAPKKRGRPKGSITKMNSKPAPAAKSKTPAKGKNSTTKAAPKSNGEHKRVADSEEPDDESSPLSDIESNFVVENASKKKVATVAASSGKMPESSRKTPRRNAAKRSQTGLKSRYFEQSEADGDDAEE